MAEQDDTPKMDPKDVSPLTRGLQIAGGAAATAVGAGANVVQHGDPKVTAALVAAVVAEGLAALRQARKPVDSDGTLERRPTRPLNTKK